MNNKGMTMVEILVVIAIIGIVGSLTTISINSLSNSNVKSVVKEIDSYMAKLRIENMSKTSQSQRYIKVSTDTSGNYFLAICDNSGLNDSSVVGDKLGNRKVNLELIKTSGNLTVSSSSVTTMFAITFGRDGSLYYVDSTGTPIDDVEGIYATNGNKEATLVTVEATGKHYVE